MHTLNCNGRFLSLSSPLVMGIINVTPDSFYAPSRKQQTDLILHQAEKMIMEGAAILDIGGQSTRPGSTQVSEEEELKRVVHVIELLQKEFPETIISVDTYYSCVAQESVKAGAGIINDISAGCIDEQLLPTVATLNVPYILMHMQGTPQTMQLNPHYDNILTDIYDFFIQKLNELNQLGIKDIILDPGIGFGKTQVHNFELLKKLPLLAPLNKPTLIGLSRKGMIWKTLNITAAEALNGTTVLHTVALLNGASILRVHDVKEAAEAITLLQNYTAEDLSNGHSGYL